MAAEIRQVHLQVLGHPSDCYIQKKLTESEDAIQEGRQKTLLKKMMMRERFKFTRAQTHWTYED
jgi:hypothetical protein